MKTNIRNQFFTSEGIEGEDKLSGYPIYPESEDIYSKFKKERRIDPDDITKFKEIEIVKGDNEKDFSDDFSGSDLDIPGSEFDEIEEIVSIEDEENNYFSLGGDDHMELEESQG